MATNKLNIFYWIATGLFAAFLLMDGVLGLMHEKTGLEVMNHLGYPAYLMSILGGFKSAGAIAILQSRYNILKEWAFAGFWISCIGAFMSRLFSGDNVGLLLFPLVFLAISLIPYMLWKKRGMPRSKVW
ncbi:MAG: DoxX family protein [Pseudomonadota bacterium]